MKTLMSIIIISFLFDQVLQPKSVRQNKHRDTSSMALHVVCWALPMWILTMYFCMKFQEFELMKWFAIICVIHFSVEWCCCRMWTNLWYQKRRSEMIMWVCLEQMILNGSIVFFFIYFLPK